MKPAIRGRKGMSEGMDSPVDAAELGSKTINYMIVLPAVIVLTIILFVAGGRYAESFLYFPESGEHQLAMERVVSCFAVKDPVTTRTYPILDMARLDEATMQTCFYRPEQGVRVILEDDTTHAVKADLKSYTRNLPWKQRIYTVLYKDTDGSLKKGVVKLEIS